VFAIFEQCRASGKDRGTVKKLSIVLILFLFMGLLFGSTSQVYAQTIEPAYAVKDWSAKRYIVRPGYYFYKKAADIGTKKRTSSKKYIAYSGSKNYFTITKLLTITETGERYVYMKGKGYINRKATYYFDERSFKFECEVKLINDDAHVYTLPPRYEGSKNLGLAKTVVGKRMQALKKYVTCVDGRYLKIELENGEHAYIDSNAVDPVLTHLKGKNKVVEKAIATGLKKMNKSKYLWGGGRTKASIQKNRFDCSSFIHYIFKKAGKTLGSYTNVTTRTLAGKGKSIPFKKIKRGDIIVLKPKKGSEIPTWHVVLYLGDRFFLHDAGDSDSGGVDIDTLNDKQQTAGTKLLIRRVA
jgi:cell wall-associated NlpC family hydrolase